MAGAKQRRASKRVRRRPERGRARARRQVTPRGPDAIEHVVLLMLENRSFDQMLGSFQAVHPRLDGVPPKGPARTNRDHRGTTYQQAPTSTRKVKPDPKHALDEVLTQITDGNRGFMRDYVRAYPKTSRAQRDTVMGYFPLGKLGPLHALADTFLICDHWFSSVPGPTWTNRLFALSGTSLGQVSMPAGVFEPNLYWYNQDTIFDRLDARNVSWAVYHDGPALSLLFTHQWRRPNRKRYHGMKTFEKDAASQGSFPSFALIEPDYLWPGANDDHPPHDVVAGQRLIARVYNALRGNPDLWAKTLLAITYDEHGGFYDHVHPPPGVRPDDRNDEYHFEQLGVRVPALLVSPWVERGFTDVVFDHTSLVRFVLERFRLGTATLGRRVQRANSVGSVLTRRTPRTDGPVRLPLPKKLAPPKSPPPLSDNQRAIVGLGEYLSLRGKKPVTRAQATRALVRGAKRRPSGARAQLAQARRQFRVFVEDGD